MLSATAFHQQLLVPLSQFASSPCSVWQSVRSLTSASVNKCRTRGSASSELVLQTTLEEGQTAADLKTEVEATFEELGLGDLVEGLRVQRIHATDVTSPILQPTQSPFKQSHVSSASFDINKYGFSPSQLGGATYRQPVALHLPKFGQMAWKVHTRYLPQSVFRQPHQGFKTKHSQSVKGFTVKGDEAPRRQALQNTMKTEKKDSLQHILSQHEDSPGVQQSIKLAFSEGYSLNALTNAERLKGSSTFKQTLVRALASSLMLIILLTLMYNLLRNALGRSVKMLQINDEMFEPVSAESVGVTFKDVKGCEEAKQELEDIVHYLKEPEKFESIGAKLPKGVLLVGGPGLGKTLLARAVAGEAQVPFIQTSGSEFDEMFVGTGAKRVRSLFQTAKQHAPCVVFIDEIDTVGAKRSNSELHPHANQTINQLLADLDGFNQNEGIIVLGATNRRDHLDRALLRAGRFDVEVSVSLPDIKGRTEMFEHYMSKIKHDARVRADMLAKATTGCTGADIENIVNQAALKAVLDGCKVATSEHFEHAKDKVLMGPAKKTKIPDKHTNLVTAYHEAGHALVAHYTEAATTIYKVTILPRGMSLGHTAFMPEKDAYSTTKRQLQARMDVAMGGRVAEEIIFGSEEVTTGASADFKSATSIAKHMVKEGGMSEAVGVRYLAEDTPNWVNHLSPAMNELMDKEIKRLLQESYTRAKSLLKSHQSELKKLADALMKYETLDKEDVQRILQGKEPLLQTTGGDRRRQKDAEKIGDNKQLTDNKQADKIPTDISPGGGLRGKKTGDCQGVS